MNLMMNMELLMMGLTGTGTGTGSTINQGVNIGNFFKNLTSVGRAWGGAFISFLGLVLIVVAIVQLVKAFLQHGKGQANWLMIGLMILVGGYLLTSGIGGVEAFSNLGKTTLENVATGKDGMTGTK